MTRQTCIILVVGLAAVAASAFGVAVRPFDAGDTRCSPVRTVLLLEPSFVVRLCGDASLRRLGLGGALAGCAIAGAVVVAVVHRKRGARDG